MAATAESLSRIAMMVVKAASIGVFAGGIRMAAVICEQITRYSINLEMAIQSRFVNLSHIIYCCKHQIIELMDE